MQVVQNRVYLPNHLPNMSVGKFSYKIVIRKDQIDSIGKGSLYLQLYDGKIKRRPIHIKILPKNWDPNKQEVKRGDNDYKDYNLIIGQLKARINDIMIQYRLQKLPLNNSDLLKEIDNPSAKLDFVAFCKFYLDETKEVLANGTLRQQKSFITKLEKYQRNIPFHSIDELWLQKFRAYMQKKLKNKANTIESTIKNFKKYLHAANEKGVYTPLKYDKISVKRQQGEREFLAPEELKKLIEYYDSKFISKSSKHILAWFLYSCCTGIRLADIEYLTASNIVDKYMILIMDKTKKALKIKLNNTAFKLLSTQDFFKNKYTREHINRELKVIMSTLEIRKRISYHCSRHTFATNFLISGGRVEQLQILLGHSKIQTTMVYVHIVEQYTDEQLFIMDEIFSVST